MSDSHGPFWEHVEELRLTVVRVLLTVAIAAVVALINYPTLVTFIQDTLQASPGGIVRETVTTQRVTNIGSKTVSVQLDGMESVQLQPGESRSVEYIQANNGLVLFGPLDGMTSVLKLCLWSGAAASSPIWLYWILAFIAPGLERNERKLIFPFLICSVLFFSLGALFCFYATLPIANSVLLEFNRGLGENLWGFAGYMQYATTLLLAHGISFELLVIMLFLVHYGRLSHTSLIRQRRLVIVGTLTLAAVLTPPDIITQCLLAAPLLLAYEALILYARFKETKKGLATAT